MSRVRLNFFIRVFPALIVVFLGFQTQEIFASRFRVGPEFNFSSVEMNNAQTESHVVNNPVNERVIAQLRQMYESRCGKLCRVETYLNRYKVESLRVTFVDGWYFEVVTDPGVIEVNTKPMSTQDIKNYSKQMEDYIFGYMKEVGLVRANDVMSNDWAGGHIHIDVEAFENNLTLFRNFIVDYTNHIELSRGIFANDSHYAPNIQLLTQSQRKAFVLLIEDTDRGQVRGINDFCRRLQDEVYTENPFGHDSIKHQALNVSRIVSSKIKKGAKTLELRAFRSQGSPEILYLQSRLLEARLSYLKKKGGEVPVEFFQEVITKKVFWFFERKMRLVMTELGKAQKFIQYVT